MNKKPLLSIGIPTYNNAYYLGMLLDSILSSAKGFEEYLEVVVLDDGSTDNTITIVESYVKKYHFIKLISQKNQGIANSRNNLLKLTNSKYHWFIDSDDILNSNAISEIINLIKRNPGVEIININIGIFHNNSNDFSDIKKLDNYKLAINFEYASLWIRIIKKSLFKNEIFPNIAYEDLAVVFNVIKKANVKNIKNITKTLLFYRIHSNSLTRTKNDKIFSLINALEYGSKNLTILETKTLYQIHLITFNSYFIFKHKSLTYKEKKQKIKANIDLMKYTFGKKALKIEKKQMSFRVKMAFLLIKYRMFLVFKILSVFSNRD